MRYWQSNFGVNPLSEIIPIDMEAFLKQSSMMATRGIDEMYVYGGALANAVPPPSTSFVARVEPGSLKELWRTDLINTNISDLWTGGGSIKSIDGDIFAITNTFLYRLNGTNGAVEGILSLPTGASLPNNSYFNGMGGWPDGTLVMKNLARAPGCTLPGFFALSNCPNLDQTPPSAMVAVDSKTFKVLDWVQLGDNRRSHYCYIVQWQGLCLPSRQVKPLPLRVEWKESHTR